MARLRKPAHDDLSTRPSNGVRKHGATRLSAIRHTNVEDAGSDVFRGLPKMGAHLARCNAAFALRR